jgi:hypothetical protein
VHPAASRRKCHVALVSWTIGHGSWVQAGNDLPNWCPDRPEWPLGHPDGQWALRFSRRLLFTTYSDSQWTHCGI